MDEQMYEDRASMPVYQSTDLDFDTARAEWEREQPDRPALTDTPEQIARSAIASYREYTERYGQSPDEATESAVREVREGLAVDVETERADRAAQPGPTPKEMEGWPL